TEEDVRTPFDGPTGTEGQTTVPIVPIVPTVPASDAFLDAAGEEERVLSALRSLGRAASPEIAEGAELSTLRCETVLDRLFETSRVRRDEDSSPVLYWLANNDL